MPTSKPDTNQTLSQQEDHVPSEPTETKCPTKKSGAPLLWCAIALQYALLGAGGFYLYQSDFFSEAAPQETSGVSADEIATLARNIENQFSLLEAKQQESAGAAFIINNPQRLQDFFNLERTELLVGLAEMASWQQNKDATLTYLQNAHSSLAQVHTDTSAIQAAMQPILAQLESWKAFSDLQLQNKLSELTENLTKLQQSNIKSSFHSEDTASTAPKSSEAWYIRLWHGIKEELPIRTVSRSDAHLSQAEIKLTEARLIAMAQEINSHLSTGHFILAENVLNHLSIEIKNRTTPEIFATNWEAQLKTIQEDLIFKREKGPDFGPLNQTLRNALKHFITNAPKEALESSENQRGAS